MTNGEKVGLLIIMFSVFFVMVYPDSYAALWMLFIVGTLIFLISGKKEIK